MKKTIKGFLLGLIIATLLMSTAFGAGIKKTIEVAFDSINLTVNGAKVDAETIVYNETTYVPLRAAAEMLGKDVGWDQATQTASINEKKVEEVKMEEPTTGTSRQNPSGINTKQIVTKKDHKGNLDYKIEITMTDLVSGQNALNTLFDEDEYLITGVSKSGYLNDRKWTDNEEFIMAKFRLKVIDTKDNKSKTFVTGSFEHVGKENVFYDKVYNISSPRNFETFLYTDIYPGGEAEGWIIFKVNKNDDKVVTVLDRDRTSEAWFDLRSDKK